MVGTAHCIMFLVLSDFWYPKVNCSPAIDQSAMTALKTLKLTNSSPTPMSIAQARVAAMADILEGGDGGSDGG